MFESIFRNRIGYSSNINMINASHKLVMMDKMLQVKNQHKKPDFHLFVITSMQFNERPTHAQYLEVSVWDYALEFWV